MHADVYGSFSWSANIVGKKRWIFLPPGEEVKLKSILGVTSLPCDLDEVDLNSLPVTYVDLIQNAGEVVFVPSGWFHQVWNLVGCPMHSSSIINKSKLIYSSVILGRYNIH